VVCGFDAFMRSCDWLDLSLLSLVLSCLMLICICGSFVCFDAIVFLFHSQIRGA
jgi:hypothetical protein